MFVLSFINLRSFFSDPFYLGYGTPISVQAHAAAAVLNFSESCTPEILTPYLDGVISKLLVLLQVCFFANIPWNYLEHQLYSN